MARPQAPDPPVCALAWVGDAAAGHLRLLDQTRLPGEEVYLERTTDEQVVADIQRLAVRGAPALGVAGANALVLAARAARPGASWCAEMAARAERIAGARPTAVNLAAAVRASLGESRALQRPPPEAAAALLAAAHDLVARETEACRRIGEAGAAWLGPRRRLLTHCNAGALVTPGIGTALAPVYWMHARGQRVFVWADETRPLLQGLRLTAWELARAGVPHRVLPDGAAAGLLASGEVDAVIVGADRVCRNGDVVNKVGTCGVALAARRHGVPFVVAAPLTTLDPATATGAEVPLESRPADLARYLVPGTLPAGTQAWAPAFDVTPADLVGALLTERGVLENPTEAGLGPWMNDAAIVQKRGDGGR